MQQTQEALRSSLSKWSLLMIGLIQQTQETLRSSLSKQSLLMIKVW
jgi:hypothetical protein